MSTSHVRRKRPFVPPPIEQGIGTAPSKGVIPPGMSDPDLPGRKFPVPSAFSGVGLAAVPGQTPADEASASHSGASTSDLCRLMTIPLDRLDASPEQAKLQVDQSYVLELADSIRESGLQEPIKVRPSPAKDGVFEIIAGHHRCAAARLLEWREISAVVYFVDERQAKRGFLITNEARRTLSDWQRAQAYHTALNVEPRIAANQKELARLIARSEANISRCLSMLKLPEPVQRLLDAEPRFISSELAAGMSRLAKERPELVPHIVAEAEVLYSAYGTEKYRGDEQSFRTATLGRAFRSKQRGAPQQANKKRVFSARDGKPVLASQVAKGNRIMLTIPAGLPAEIVDKHLSEQLKDLVRKLESEGLLSADLADTAALPVPAAANRRAVEMAPGSAKEQD